MHETVDTPERQADESLGRRVEAAMAGGRIDAALALLRQAITGDPQDGHLRRQLGNLLSYLGDLQGAVACYRAAVDLRPRDAETWIDLGNALTTQGSPEQAIGAYGRAQTLSPGHPVATGNEALALLLSGDYRRGLPKYESRWLHAPLSMARPRTALPRWSGAPPEAGARILVFPEQGLGDAIMMSRYLPLLARRFAAAACLVAEPLARLFRHSLGGAVTIATDRRTVPDSAFTHHCPILSLPLAFGTDLASIPPPDGVLTADSDAVAAWAARTQTGQRLRVGLVWAGRRQNTQDRFRSIPLAAFRPLFDVPGVAWFSLQKDDPRAEIAAGGLTGRLFDPMADCHDFMDTAALVATLDLVIAVDTAVAHLAGALGVPVWLLNRAGSEWRWLRDRTDSPWYPSVRLFNQQKPGDWSPVLTDVAARLRLQAACRQIRFVRAGRGARRP